MLNDENKNNNSKLLGSLVSDLKRSLVLIARQAELGETDAGKPNSQSIQTTAEQTLKLIDSYLLVSQSEYGQQLLPVKSFSVGSVIYNIAEEIRPIARKSNIDLVTNVNDGLVMANPEGLGTIIWCLSDMVLSQTLSGSNNEAIEITTKKSMNNIRVSVLSRSFKIKNSDIEKAQKNLGKAHMALSSQVYDSGARLAIANLLGESLGTSLKAVKQQHAQGIGFNLNLSKQLQLV